MVPDPLLIGRPDRAAWLPRARLPLALLAILAGVGAALVPGVLSLAVLGVGATMVGLLKPQWLLTALVVGAFTFDFLVSKGLLPGAARWLPEAAIVLLAIRLALTRLARPLPLRGAGMVDLAVALLIVAAGLGIAVGREHAITTALGLRGWFVLIGLFYVLVNDEALLPVTGRLWWILWALVAVQPVPVFLQWYFSACRNCYVDQYYGTLMSTATLGILGGMMAGCALSLYLERGEFKWTLPIVPLLIALGLADAKGGLLMVAGAIGAIIAYRTVAGGFLHSKWRLTAALVVGGVLLAGGVEFATRNLNVDVRQLVFNPRALTEYAPYDDGTGQNVTRASDLRVAWAAATNERRTVWIGAGPGSGTQSALGTYVGTVYREYAARTGRSVFWVQGGRLLVELGMLGVVATLGLAAALVGLAARAYRRAASSFERAVALTLVGQVVVFLMSHVYQTLHDLPRLAIWLSAAVAVATLRQASQAPRAGESSSIPRAPAASGGSV